MAWHGKGFAAAFGGLALLVSTGCQEAPQASQADPVAVPTLPISINAAMISVVDHSADYIFALGNGDMPKSDHDWDLVRIAAYEAILSGKVIQLEGSGSNDAEWIADPEWQMLSDQLTTIGQEALELSEAKSTDTEAWRALGDRLVDNCLACHEKFKPEIPSEGILHESTERESKGESIFD